VRERVGAGDRRSTSFETVRGSTFDVGGHRAASGSPVR
jgi:hypothetical protein